MLLTGEVKYSANSARNELINEKPKQINLSLPLIQLEDENYTENISTLLKGKVYLKDRILAKFSDNSYAVMYTNDPLNVRYYSPYGDLTHFEIKSGTTYPYKAYKYDINKNLVNMSLRVSEAETFIFTPSGKLIAHWLKDKGYDERGNIIMTREYLE